VFAQLGIWNFIHKKLFALARLKTANNFLCKLIAIETSFNPQKIGTKANGLLVGGIEIAFSKAQKVNGIQQIGFARAIVSGNTT